MMDIETATIIIGYTEDDGWVGQFGDDEWPSDLWAPLPFTKWCPKVTVVDFYRSRGQRVILV